jgi:hypothetical protein
MTFFAILEPCWMYFSAFSAPHKVCAKNQMAQSVCVSQITARRVNFHRRLFFFPKSLSESKCALISQEENMTKIIRHAEERATNYHNLAL